MTRSVDASTHTNYLFSAVLKNEPTFRWAGPQVYRALKVGQYGYRLIFRALWLQANALETPLADLQDDVDGFIKKELPTAYPFPVNADRPLLDHPHGLCITGNQTRLPQ